MKRLTTSFSSEYPPSPISIQNTIRSKILNPQRVEESNTKEQDIWESINYNSLTQYMDEGNISHMGPLETSVSYLDRLLLKNHQVTLKYNRDQRVKNSNMEFIVKKGPFQTNLQAKREDVIRKSVMLQTKNNFSFEKSNEEKKQKIEQSVRVVDQLDPLSPKCQNSVRSGKVTRDRIIFDWDKSRIYQEREA